MQLHPDPITIDITNPIESQFLIWYNANRDKTKDIILSGYYFIQNGISQYYQEYFKANADQVLRTEHEQLQKMLQDTKHLVSLEARHKITALEEQLKDYQSRLQQQQSEFAAYKSTCTSSYLAEIDRLRNTIQDLEEKATQSIAIQYQEKLERIKSTHTLELVQATQEVRREAEQYKAMYNELTSRMQCPVKTAYEDRIEALAKQLIDREYELALLKKTNAAKGALGENLIAHHLRQYFPAAEIYDTSKIKHSCDIHMKLDNRYIFAFESKVKDTITPQDIEKFYRDTEQMVLTNGENFLGAAFISLRTKNIPTKGDLFFDQVKSRPVLFIGFPTEDQIDPLLFSSLLKLLTKIAFYQQKTNQHATTVQDLIEKLKPVLTTISRTRTDIDTIKTMASKIIDSTINLDRDISKSIDTLFSITGFSHSPVIQLNEGPPNTLTCPNCDKACKSKAGLESHMRACLHQH